jgi:hypothetical protein
VRRRPFDLGRDRVAAAPVDDAEVVVSVLLAWCAVAVVASLVIARLLRMADAPSTYERPLTTADLPEDLRPAADPTAS